MVTNTYSTIKEYTFFLGMHGMLANIDPSLNYKARFFKYQRTNILQDIFYEFNAIKSRVSYLAINKEESMLWKFKYTLQIQRQHHDGK